MDLSQLQGLLSAQPDEAEQRMAKMQGLLGLGIGLLSGSRGNYGAFAPALAQGLQGGMQGFVGAQQMGQMNRRGRAQEAIAMARLQSEMSGNRMREQEAAERAAERQRRQMWQDSVARATAPPAPMSMPVAGSMGGLDSYDPPNAAPTPAPRMTPELLQTLGIQGIGMGGENLLAEAARLRAENAPQTITVQERQPDGSTRSVLRNVPRGQGDGMVVNETPAAPPPTITTDRGIERWNGTEFVPTGRFPYRAPPQGPAPQFMMAPDPKSPTGFSMQQVRAGLPVAPPRAGNTLPSAALKIQDDAIEQLAPLGGLNNRIDRLMTELAPGGNLQLGPMTNLANRGLNAAGISTEQSRAYEDLRTNLETFRNGILMLHKGTQTEGDAKRAMDTIVQNINDRKVVMQALGRLRELNDETARLQMTRVNTVRREYGASPMDFQPITGNTGNLPAPGIIGGGGSRGQQQGGAPAQGQFRVLGPEPR
jgi:hypothetical protein